MFYYFAEISKELIDIKRDIPADEFDNIEPHIKSISKMMTDCCRIDPVMITYQSLIENIENLKSRNSSPKSPNIQYNLSQYLFEFKKFLDNWETDIKRKYGNESNEIKLFKNSQAEEYEEHMAYRIMYRLRNFDQHCGNIISKTSLSIDENGNRTCKLLIDRDFILENYDEWKQPEIDYLKKQPSHIEITNFIFQLQKSIINIFEKTMQIHFNNELLASCARMIEVANEFDNEDNVCIIKNEKQIDEKFWSQQTKKLNFTNLMIPTCKKILFMHLRNNASHIKIVYHGERYKNKFKDFAIEIDSIVAEKISQSEFINWDGKNMIRIICEIELVKGDLYAVLADSRFKYSEIKKICEDFSWYLKVLCKRNN